MTRSLGHLVRWVAVALTLGLSAGAPARAGGLYVNEFSTYVAVDSAIANEAQQRLLAGKVKGRSVKVRLPPS